MSFINKTTNYQLPQWTSGEKPTMADFNEANQKIDTGLGAINSQLANKVSVSYCSAQ